MPHRHWHPSRADLIPARADDRAPSRSQATSCPSIAPPSKPATGGRHSIAATHQRGRGARQRFGEISTLWLTRAGTCVAVPGSLFAHVWRSRFPLKLCQMEGEAETLMPPRPSRLSLPISAGVPGSRGLVRMRNLRVWAHGCSEPSSLSLSSREMGSFRVKSHTWAVRDRARRTRPLYPLAHGTQAGSEKCQWSLCTQSLMVRL